MGLVVSTFGDHLRAELPACLPVLVDRMGNEITRLTAVKVFFFIVTSFSKTIMFESCPNAMGIQQNSFLYLCLNFFTESRWTFFTILLI